MGVSRDSIQGYGSLVMHEVKASIRASTRHMFRRKVFPWRWSQFLKQMTRGDIAKSAEFLNDRGNQTQTQERAKMKNTSQKGRGGAGGGL